MKKKSVESEEHRSQQPSDEGIAAATTQLPVEVWSTGGREKSVDNVARETAVALVYNDVSHAVMMASPQDLEAFALGFSLTEGIITALDEVYDVNLKNTEAGVEVSLNISSQCFSRLKEKRRSLTGRTGCGICGAESLQQVRLPLSNVVADFSVSHAAIDRATAVLDDHQPLQQLTGAAHGAAWCSVDGDILCLCEDIGRHNALDKLIGKLWQSGQLGQAGFLLISSRASYEILQKSAMAKLGIVVAVSAATAMAIDIARQADITLIGFSRQNRHVVYSGAQRLLL